MTCERINGSFLYWTVTVPSLATSRETVVANQGAISSTHPQINALNSTVFNVTRTSGNPLTSKLLVNDVTTEMNESTIYCSEDGNTNGAPMVIIHVINKGIL